MAKRTAPRNPTEETDQSTTRRVAKPRTKKADVTDSARALATVHDVRSTGEELPNIPEPGDAADRAQQYESMTSEPSEQDIRLRAYQRYLERGGGHGGHFDDWVEAERELKARSSKSEV